MTTEATAQQAPNAGATPAPDPVETETDFETAFAEFAEAKDSGADPEPNPAPDAGPEAGAAGGDADSSAQTQGGEAGTQSTKSEGTQPVAAATGTQPDIWNDAKPEHRDAYKAAQDEKAKLENTLKAERGRQGALQRQLNDAKRLLDEERAAKRTDASSKPPAQAQAANPEKAKRLKAFQEEYPEVAGPIMDLITDLQGQLSTVESRAAKAERELGGMSQERRQANLDHQEKLLADRHPDWIDATQSPEFEQWINSQLPFIQQAAIRNGERIVDAEEAAHLLNLFKRDRGDTTRTNEPDSATGGEQPATTGAANSQQSKPDALRQRRLESGRTITAKGPGPASGAPNDFEAAFDHFAAEQEKKKRRA